MKKKINCPRCAAVIQVELQRANVDHIIECLCGRTLIGRIVYRPQIEIKPASRLYENSDDHTDECLCSDCAGALAADKDREFDEKKLWATFNLTRP